MNPKHLLQYIFSLQTPLHKINRLTKYIIIVIILFNLLYVQKEELQHEIANLKEKVNSLNAQLDPYGKIIKYYNIL